MAVSNLRCLVVDDDPLSVQVVLNCINNTPFLMAAGGFTNPVETAGAMRAAPVDLLFLNVKMPLLLGIELLGTLQRPSLVVLITSSKDYAVQAFEHAVIDYLVKPVSYARFLQAAQKALVVAELDVIVDKTGEIRRGQKYIPVNLLQQDIVDFTAPATRVRVGQSVSFDSPEAQLLTCRNVQFI